MTDSSSNVTSPCKNMVSDSRLKASACFFCFPPPPKVSYSAVESGRTPPSPPHKSSIYSRTVPVTRESPREGERVEQREAAEGWKTAQKHQQNTKIRQSQRLQTHCGLFVCFNCLCEFLSVSVLP